MSCSWSVAELGAAAGSVGLKVRRIPQDCLTNDVEQRPSMKEVVERLTAIDQASVQQTTTAAALHVAQSNPVS